MFELHDHLLTVSSTYQLFILYYSSKDSSHILFCNDHHKDHNVMHLYVVNVLINALEFFGYYFRVVVSKGDQYLAFTSFWRVVICNDL